MRTVRTMYGLEQIELAAYIGRGRSAVAMYESGRTAIPLDVIARIHSEFPDAPKAPVESEEVKVLGTAIGEDSYATIKYAGVVPCSSKWGDPLTSEESRPIEAKFSGFDRFLCKVSGDSCWPALQQGDLTIWEADKQPPYGVIVIAQQSTDGGCTVKELAYDRELHRPRLMPVNPMTDEPEDGDGWYIAARLVGVIRTTDGPEKTWYWPAGLRPSHLL
jgi:transcriptional regulator with XRE-family HTH domain